MSDNKSLLGLYVPQQVKDETEAAYARPRDAEKWIAELPVAHVGETARLVFKALADLNRVNISANQRYKILELFRHPVTYITEALNKHFIGQSFPLSEKNQKIAELARELQWETAIGYKIIIESNLSGFDQRIDSKMLFSAIQRAIAYLGLTLLKAFQIYAATPKHVWIELHHLYLFSEHNDFHNTSIKVPQENATRVTTINDTYKRILLLSLANPYRLPQTEIGKVYNALDKWTQHCQILPLTDPNNPPGLFSVNLDVDAAPSYYVPNKNQLTTYTRIINTSELTPLVRDYIVEQTQQENETPAPTSIPLSPFNLQQQTLRRLILAWGAIPKRNFSRADTNIDVAVALGINATHFFIYKEEIDKTRITNENEHEHEHEMPIGIHKPESVNLSKHIHAKDIDFEEKAYFSSHPAHSALSTPEDDVWEQALNPSKNQLDLPVFGPPGSPSSGLFGQSTTELYTSYPCLLTNESVGGCHLIWHNGQLTKTVVGSLIGVQRRNETEQTQWNIGVIRWMKNIGNANMELGIEILAPTGQTVATKNITNKMKTNEYIRSLLLPELRTVNQPPTLITMPFYHVGDKLKCFLQGKEMKIRLTKLLESTNTFCQFQFAIIKPVERKSQIDKMDRVKNFDSLWSSL